MVPAASDSMCDSELFSILNGPTPLATPISRALRVLFENCEGLRGLMLVKGECFLVLLGEVGS